MDLGSLRGGLSEMTNISKVAI